MNDVMNDVINVISWLLRPHDHCTYMLLLAPTEQSQQFYYVLKHVVESVAVSVPDQCCLI